MPIRGLGPAMSTAWCEGGIDLSEEEYATLEKKLEAMLIEASKVSD
jgi:hypothetical protein